MKIIFKTKCFKAFNFENLKIIQTKDATSDHVQFEIIALSGSLFGAKHKDLEAIEERLHEIEPIMDSKTLCGV